MLDGAVKNDSNKPRYDLIDPEFLEELAHNMTVPLHRKVGAYPERNWEKGMAWGRLFRALLSHAFKFWRGESYDEEGFHHMAAVGFCAQALYVYDKNKIGTDDRPLRCRGSAPDIAEEDRSEVSFASSVACQTDQDRQRTGEALIKLHQAGGTPCQSGRDGDCGWLLCPQRFYYQKSCPLYEDDPEL